MSIYETIGGNPLLAETVEKFYAKLRSDPVISVFFEHTDGEQLESHQRMFLTAALGGPDAYKGRDMRAAHAHLQITDTDFERFLDHLAETLAELGIPPARIAGVLEALAPLRVEIVSAAREAADEWGASDPTGGSG